MNRKLMFLMIFMCIFIVGAMGFVDAKMKDYDSLTQTVDIDSSFLGIKTGDIAQLTLNTPLNYKVGAGYQKVAEFTTTFQKDYDDAFKEMKFYNKRNYMTEFQRNFDYKYLTIEEYYVDDYTCSPFTHPNGTTSNDCIVSGNHLETKEVWLPLTNKAFKQNDELTIGIFTHVQIGDYVEWIPTFFGVEIDEWATWTASLNVGIISYYSFDEGSGDVIDAAGHQNATNNGAVNASGKVFSAYDFNANKNIQIADNASFENVGAISIQAWVYPDGYPGGNNAILDKGDGASGFNIQDSGGTLLWRFSNSESLGTSQIPTGQWTHVIVTWDGTTMSTYYDGNNVGNLTSSTAITQNANDIRIGTIYSGSGNAWDGRIDEVGFWNRSLSLAEIRQLYNSGTGITYTTDQTITINYPANNSNFTATNVTFNATIANFTTPISEVKLFINGELNNTNSSGLNGTYLWTMNFADGLYNWSVGVEDTIATTTNSSLRNFTIDTVDPTITNLLPNSRQGFKAKNTNQSVTWNVTDTNIASCWYNLNGTNTTVTCADNTTNISVQNRNYSLTFYANDTAGNEANSVISWDYSVLEVAKVFNAAVVTGSSQEFSINLTYNATEFTNNNVLLQYNGTNYTTTKSGPGESFVFNRTIDVPIVTSEVNLTFNWSIGLNNGTVYTYESSSSNQTISAITVDNCSTNAEVLYNFTIVDEKLQTILNGATQNTTSNINLQFLTKDRSTQVASYNVSFNETNSFSICLSNNLIDGTEYVSDVELQYGADQYVSEFYNIQNSSITNADFPTNITLYDLSNSTSTTFTIKYKDANFLAIKDALIQIQRKYIEEGVFKTVELPKTDAQGITVGHLVPEDVIYTFVVVKNGVILDTFNNLIANCQSAILGTCEITLKSFATQIQTKDYTQLEDFAYTLSINTSTRVITSVFSIPSGSSASVSLNVTVLDMLGTAACADALTSASGTLTCTVATGLGNKTVIAKVFKDGVEMGGGTLFLGDVSPADRFGNNLIFLSVFLFLTLIGIGIGSDPKVMAIFIFIGFVIAVAMNLVSSNFIGTGATVLWLLIVIGIVLIKGGKRE